MNVWVAGKTVRSLIMTCQPQRFRDDYRTHYKAYTNVLFTLLTTKTKRLTKNI